MKNRIHEKICQKVEPLAEWYASRLKGSYIPFYSSFDIRDAGFKLGNVDGNIFPAGFNNICQMDKDHAPEVVTHFMKKHYPEVRNILLLTEDHLKNMYYWENVISIRDVLLETGYEVAVGMLSPEIEKQKEVQSFSGQNILVHHVFSEDGSLRTKEQIPDLVISNNDFSLSYDSVDFSQSRIVPARELGWFQRKKKIIFNTTIVMPESSQI